ncbi:MAG: putative peptidoglycan glycosyltransferase FtsW [bacterium]
MWRAPTILVVAILILVAIGVVMLASAGSADAGRQTAPPDFLQKQLIWLAVAICAGVASAVLIDYHWWRKLAVPLLVIGVIGLLAVFVPHVGCKVNGARRWVQLLGFRGQPSEFSKFAVIVALASWMTHAGRRATSLRDGLLIPVGILGVVLLLVMGEPDYGTTLLIAVVGMTIMLLGGTRILHLFVVSSTGAVMFLLAILHNEERTRRFFAFLNPAQYLQEGYQLRQSLNALVLGGGSGSGLGRSLQKCGYLPEARTDFIFPIIGEELGIAATLAILVLFVVFFICGTVISLRASDTFGRLLGLGITVMITVQAAINIGVVTGCLPTKGLPLPFISAGGSNLVVALLCSGVLVNIAFHSEGAVEDDHTQVIRDSLHWG